MNPRSKIYLALTSLFALVVPAILYLVVAQQFQHVAEGFSLGGYMLLMMLLGLTSFAVGLVFFVLSFLQPKPAQAQPRMQRKSIHPRITLGIGVLAILIGYVYLQYNTAQNETATFFIWAIGGIILLIGLLDGLDSLLKRP